jgi:hypothetical protein
VQGYVAWRQQFLDADGQLLPKYSPAPMGLNFRDESEPVIASADSAEPAATRRTAIPVPAGPNELW